MNPRRNLAVLIVTGVVLLVGAAFLGDALNVTGGAGRRTTGNELSAGIVPRGTLSKCQRVARQNNLVISSTYRNPSHNAAVGGVVNSMHTRGSLSNPGACDFSGTYRNYQRGMAQCRRLGSTELLIHSVTGGGGLHLHCGWVR